MQHLLLLCSLACINRTIPPHLIAQKVESPSGQNPVTNKQELISTILQGDPLARHITWPTTSEWRTLSHLNAIAALVTVIEEIERGAGVASESLRVVETSWPDSEVVAMARGYRAKMVEGIISTASDQTVSDEDELQLLLLTSQLLSSSTNTEHESTGLLKIVFGEAPILSWVDGWVLRGWLSSPNVDLSAVGSALEVERFARLLETPEGALIHARFSQLEGDTSMGWSQLERASLLQLTKAAADRDSEQGAWADLRAVTAAELQTDDPVGTLLTEALSNLTAGASKDRATSGAIIAMSALRWTNRGQLHQRGGLDKIDFLRAADRFDSDQALTDIWRVIALKEALDTLDVGRETAMFQPGLVALVDALLGTGAGPVYTDTILQDAPSEVVWLAIGRAVGEEGATDWERARAALGAHLEIIAQRAARKSSSTEQKRLLMRIASRAKG